MKPILDNINEYYESKKTTVANDGITFFLDTQRVGYCKKDIFLMCCKNTFFNTNSAPIQFLTPDILLKKGNNNILVEISLDNYNKTICYSIKI